ncbi:MAG: ABC transporter permease [Sporichthyaceae bacterium]
MSPAAEVARVPRFGARLVFERNLISHRRAWLAIVSGFFEPLFYLLSLTVGVSALVGTVQGPGGRAIPYEEFVAPAMMGAAAMNGAVFDASYNLHFKLRNANVFKAIRATPLTARDIAIGEIGSSMARGGIYSTVFVLVMLGMGLISSPWAILAVPVALLIGFAFAAIAAALTTWVRHWGDLEWVGVALIPLFLFSATFYPVSRYPDAVEPFVAISPLYHGVVVLRGLTTGEVGPGLLGHVAVLLVLGVGGLWIASRRLEKILTG